MARWLNENSYDDLIVVAGKRYNVDPLLIKAVIGQESGFKAGAELKEVSDSSRGLMQLLEAAAREIGFTGPVERLYDPKVNIQYGTMYLKKMLDASTDVESAISRYNGGYRPQFGFGVRATQSGRVCLRTNPITRKCDRWHYFNAGEFGNQGHVDKVMGNLEYFRKQLPLSPGELPEITVRVPVKPSVTIQPKTAAVGGLIAAILSALAYFLFKR